MNDYGFPVAAPRPIRDAGLALTRILLGVVLIAHGWQKLQLNGLEATSETFDEQGVPAPDLSSGFAAFVELGGGVLLVLGLLTPVVGLLVALVLGGAWWFVHRGNGIFVADQGWELVAVIGLASVVFALVGPGRWSLDAVLTERRQRRRSTQQSVSA